MATATERFSKKNHPHGIGKTELQRTFTKLRKGMRNADKAKKQGLKWKRRGTETTVEVRPMTREQEFAAGVQDGFIACVQLLQKMVLELRDGEVTRILEMTDAQLVQWASERAEEQVKFRLKKSGGQVTNVGRVRRSGKWLVFDDGLVPVQKP